MTIAAATPSFIQTPGNGTATIFAFPFKIFQATDLVVGFVVSGGYTIQASGFTVQNVDVNGGGQVMFSTAPPSGTTVDIRSNTPQTQPTEFANLGAFFPETHTEAFDRVTRELQDLTRTAYTFGIHGPDQESTPWPPLPTIAVRKGQQLIFDPTTGLPTVGVPSTQVITQGLLAPFLNLQITAAESAAGVTPANLGYAPYTAPRYGVVFDGVTDNTTALNQAIAACIQAGSTLNLLLDGTALHGRLTAFSGPLKIRGNGKTKSILKVNPGAWPYTSNTNPVMSSAYDFEAEGVGFDQSWLNATFGDVGGAYSDGANPSTWGGNWLGTFTGANFRVFRCGFSNITRGFWVAGATNVEFSYNEGVSLATDSQSICATSLCTNVRKEHNFLTGPKWTSWNSVSQPYTGLSALYCFGDINVEDSHNITVGYQRVLCGNAGTSLRCVFMGNIVDTPVADCAFQNWNFLSITGNVIHMSGDMGIATDNSNYVSVTGNVIDSVMTGCINVGGATSATVTGNVCKDWMQAYALINTLGARFSSTAGAWGSAISVNFQSPDTGGNSVCISGNSCTMATLPPVSDIHGPIRAVTNGIYLQTTPSASHITGAVAGNFVQQNYAQLPNMFVFVPVYQSFLSAKTGTPIPGELFTNGSNSFVYLGDYGVSGSVQYKHLIGTTPASTAFTGALSGAVLTTASSAQGPFWLIVKEHDNVDWTEVGN